VILAQDCGGDGNVSCPRSCSMSSVFVSGQTSENVNIHFCEFELITSPQYSFMECQFTRQVYLRKCEIKEHKGKCKFYKVIYDY
jgi:hypothetical protein